MALIWLQIIDHVLWIVLVSDNVRWWSCHKPIVETTIMSFVRYVGVRPDVKCKQWPHNKIYISQPTIYPVICVSSPQNKRHFPSAEALSVISAEFGFWISPSYSSWQTACCSLSVCPKPADFLRFPSAGRHHKPCGLTAGTGAIGSAQTAPLSYGL